MKDQPGFDCPGLSTQEVSIGKSVETILKYEQEGLAHKLILIMLPRKTSMLEYKLTVL